MVRKMVYFLYGGNYGTSMKGEEGYGSVSGLQVHARMFALGDKYDIPALREFAANKFLTRLTTFSTDLDILGCVPDVYRLTPPSVRSLREMLSKEARLRLEKYLKDLESREAFESVTTEVPEFVTDVLDMLVKTPLLASCFKCARIKPMTLVQAKCCDCRYINASVFLKGSTYNLE